MSITLLSAEFLLEFIPRWVAHLQTNPRKIENQWAGLSEYHHGELCCCALGWAQVVYDPATKIAPTTISLEAAEMYDAGTPQFLAQLQYTFDQYDIYRFPHESHSIADIVEASDCYPGWETVISRLSTFHTALSTGELEPLTEEILAQIED